MSKVKVLYIAGAGRSGSTILCNMLGEINNIFSAGEMYEIWRALVNNRLCGCATSLLDCKFWGPVLLKLFNDYPLETPESLLRMRDSLARTRYSPAWIFSPHQMVASKDGQLYSQILGRLYSDIVEASHCNLIIDSSKVSTYGKLLSLIPKIDLYTLHLTRDARAVAFSRARRKPKATPQGTVYIKQFSPLHSAIGWLAHNLLTEILLTSTKSHYLRLQYEKFIAQPTETLSQIMSFVNQGHFEQPTITNQIVKINKHHTVGGNPDRFKTGGVQLRTDDEWITKMRASDKITVTSLTWPLLSRYGYI
jgi:hypothetical protein